MALLATTLLAACSKVPDGILSEKKMQGVLTDMLLAEAMVNVDYNTYKSDTMKLALYESVFRKHDITQAVYDSSLVWYGRNLDIYMEVYNRVLADLNKRINNLGDVQADAAPVSNRDSVDIWPRRSYLVNPFLGRLIIIRYDREDSVDTLKIICLQLLDNRPCTITSHA